MRDQCFWLWSRRGCRSGSDLIIGRCEPYGGRGRKNASACLQMCSGKKEKHSRALVDCWLQQSQQTLNSPDSIWGVQIQSNPIPVVSLQRGRPCTELTVKFFPGSFRRFFFIYLFFISLRAVKLTKSIKNILQLNVSETKWFKISIFSKSLTSEIHTVRQSCPTECPHLGQSATNVSLNFEM